MEKEYKYIPKTHHKIKITMEHIPYTKKKFVKFKTKEEIAYEKALAIKSHFLNARNINTIKMCEVRTHSIYDSEEFKELIRLGKLIRKYEIGNYLCYAGCLVASFLLVLFLSLFMSPWIMCAILPMIFIYWAIFKPRVKFKTLFDNVYLPICYICAGVADKSNEIKFTIDKVLKNWNKKAVNTSVVTNKFSVTGNFFKSIVRKIIVRNYLTIYGVRNGKVNVTKKLSTIFSGYSFDMTYSQHNINNKHYKVKSFIEGDSRFDDLQIAIVNSNTFYGATNLYDEEIEKLKLYTPKKRLIDDDWRIYVNKDLNLPEKGLREIQKKILMINNEIGIFNAYISKEDMKMLLNIQINKDGLQESKFQTQLKKPEKLTFDAFYAIVKTLYIINCMHKLHKVFYGETEHSINQSKLKKKNKMQKKYSKNFNRTYNKPFSAGCEYNTNVLIKPISPKNFAPKNTVFTKRGSTSIDIAIRVLITVILSGVLLFGYYTALDDFYVPGMQSKAENTYSENNITTIVNVNDLR